MYLCINLLYHPGLHSIIIYIYILNLGLLLCVLFVYLTMPVKGYHSLIKIQQTLSCIHAFVCCLNMSVYNMYICITFIIRKSAQVDWH